jgi:hypothetical protein
MIDVQVVGKDGRLRRVRKIAPVQTRRAAEKLEHEIRNELLRADDRVATPATESPRFAALAEQFVSTYAVTNDKRAEVIRNMKKLRTPRDLQWNKDRVAAFRSHHRIRQGKPVRGPDILTGQQARDYLGVGYHGLTVLIRRGAIRTNQVTDFAPWRISRAELDSERVQRLVRALKKAGRLPAEGGSPQGQLLLFPEKTQKT